MSKEVASKNDPEDEEVEFIEPTEDEQQPIRIQTPKRTWGHVLTWAVGLAFAWMVIRGFIFPREPYPMHRRAFCEGFEAGWIEGYCGETLCSYPPAPACPGAPARSPDPSFVTGAAKGEAMGLRAAGRTLEDQKDDNPYS
ncbi:MAG: hypothetical protein ACREGC_04430 [Minisyncoccia bacterium]